MAINHATGKLFQPSPRTKHISQKRGSNIPLVSFLTKQSFSFNPQQTILTVCTTHKSSKNLHMNHQINKTPQRWLLLLIFSALLLSISFCFEYSYKRHPLIPISCSNLILRSLLLLQQPQHPLPNKEPTMTYMYNLSKKNYQFMCITSLYWYVMKGLSGDFLLVSVLLNECDGTFVEDHGLLCYLITVLMMVVMATMIEVYLRKSIPYGCTRWVW